MAKDDGNAATHRVFPIDGYLRDLHAAIKDNFEGAVADYIPELTRADPADLGICLATVDGKLYRAGASDTPFTIQSMSKPISYGYALREYPPETVLAHVGVEPTGEAFNSIVLDEVHNRPFNPMVNAGAIATTELIKGADAPAREAEILRLFSAMAGRPLTFDEQVYASELATGHRNRAIAYMMLNSGMISSDPEEVLSLYFKQCAVLVTCEDMAVMAATLANGGTNPVTGEKVFEPDHVRDILTLMSTCGMYNYAGQWAFEVGIPAKSGVAGGIFAVIPGQAGIAVYSPLLDGHGNSIRGVEVCKAISREFSLHSFSDHTNVSTAIRREGRGSEMRSKRLRSGAEQELLSREGDRIAVIEVQGALYFGSTELLIRRISNLTSDVQDLIVDFKRVSFADGPARRLIVQTVMGFPFETATLTFTGISEGGPLAALREDLAALTPKGLRFAVDNDAALEACEETLLETFIDDTDQTRFALSRLDLFSGMQREDLQELEQVVVSFQHDAGTQILREGDPAAMFYVVARGSVSISVAKPDGTRRRLAAAGPGQSFGEMALVDGGKRTADVFAEQTTICYGFPVDAVNEISQRRPNLMPTILANMVRNLTHRLGQANTEIRALM